MRISKRRDARAPPGRARAPRRRRARTSSDDPPQVSEPSIAKRRIIRCEEGQGHVALARSRQTIVTTRLPAISGRARDLERGLDRRAGRDPDQEALALGGLARAVSSASSSSTAITSSITVAVEHLGHEAGADPLDLVRARAAPPERTAERRRLDRDDLHAGPALLQHLAHAGDRAAGADADDEASTSPSSVAPDLLGGRAPVDLRVRRVGELLRHEAASRSVAISLGELDRLVHPAERGRLVDLGAVGAQQLVALAAHPLGQGEDQLVAARRADHRQGDPGVAAGRLDDHRAAPARSARRARRRRSSPPRSGP